MTRDDVNPWPFILFPIAFAFWMFTMMGGC